MSNERSFHPKKTLLISVTDPLPTLNGSVVTKLCIFGGIRLFHALLVAFVFPPLLEVKLVAQFLPYPSIPDDGEIINRSLPEQLAAREVSNDTSQVLRLNIVLSQRNMWSPRSRLVIGRNT